MKKEVNTLFSLFRCALFGETISDEVKADCAEKAAVLYKMANHHDLAHLVKYAVDVSGIKITDAAAEFELLRYQAMSVLRYENLDLALKNISELFEQEKIPHIPLKGAVIRDLYPEPWMRTSCDIDILVREEDVKRAEKAVVEKLGFRSKGEWDYHDISLYSEMGVHLELHFNIKENMKNIDGLLEKVWDYALPKTEGSYEYKLSDEFLIFQFVAHMYYHVYGGGCSIRNFVDLFLLERKLGYDRDILLGMMEKCEITKFYETARLLSEVWFSDAEHNDLTLLFQKYLLGGGVYGTKKNSIAANSDKKNPFSYLVGRVYMPYDKLCIKYPIVKEKPYLSTYYQIKRFVSAIGKGSAVNVCKGLDANNSVSENEIKEYTKLFENLGIRN